MDFLWFPIQSFLNMIAVLKACREKRPIVPVANNLRSNIQFFKNKNLVVENILYFHNYETLIEGGKFPF